ncbi:lactate racemase domain-containing protein [Feifania hominis]|uniref:DUF2088 domain-containing protein n=1 Tax=Feifania hominis TaxID=2763660 RepID=A0A926DC51_9FIRM|nr:lactate racemase domain-containing protein [Feifania hominis]MBC8535137.1 DUF2088 domain-containing protein [Feifania hominis]
MENIYLYENTAAGIDETLLKDALVKSLEDRADSLKKVLLLPPDFTRLHSNAGKIANLYYHILTSRGCHVDLMPALGTHVPMTRQECAQMYGDIPFERFRVHNWRDDVVELGVVPAPFVEEVSRGTYRGEIPAQVNRALLEDYDLILSIGQVVPHEVVGMANYTKNLMVGVGGSAMINASHMIGAFYGLEQLMGRDHSPVRRIFDYCEKNFLSKLPLRYVLTVTTAPGGEIQMHGLFIGDDRGPFEKAVKLAQEKNMTLVEQPLKKAVVLLDEQEFKSTWLGNKAVYRTRMAIADGGELVVLAPGVEKFGEDPEIDRLIRKYGYRGREYVIGLLKDAQHADLQSNLSAAAHLIHGSSDGRFRITYCTRHLSRQEVESVGYCYAPYEEMAERYNPKSLTPGRNHLENGEELYYIPNPALGLWADKSKFQ